MRALPSLSVAGGLALGPRYRSSKESHAASAEVAEDAAAVADAEAEDALVAALIA